MNDSHPSDMPHVDGTPGLGQVVPLDLIEKRGPIAALTPEQERALANEVAYRRVALEQLILLTDAVEQVTFAMPANSPVVVNVLAAPADIYAINQTGATFLVEHFAVWSRGEVTPMVWLGDGKGIHTVEPEMMHDWTVIEKPDEEELTQS